MSSPFAAIEIWSALRPFMLIAVALLLSVVLQRKLEWLRRSLVPTALIAGLLLLIGNCIPLDTPLVDKHAMETITYHALGLGFGALALKKSTRSTARQSATIARTGALTAATYLVQGLCGLAISIPLFFWWKDDCFYASGLLLPMAYGQGPGQALNMGNLFAERSAEQGYVFAGSDFGLTLAATGFVAGSVVGVIYLNIMRRKGRLLQRNDSTTHYTLADYEAPDEIPHSESIDKLSIQLCLVFAMYAAVYMLMSTVEHCNLGTFGQRTLKPLIWGFNFLWATLLGVLIRSVFEKLQKRSIIHRTYINNHMLDRIAGVCFDIMITAGTAAICFERLQGLLLPLLLMAILGAVVTFLFLYHISRILFKGYADEGFLSMFGMLTGTASNGMILLREVDPQFSTPAARNLVLQSIPAVLFGAPVLLLMGYAPLGLRQTLITAAILMVLLVGLIIFICFTPKSKRKTTSLNHDKP